ncbi:MAG TPA: spore germination protein [Bacillota bacterium]|nr:spore germination protein [Bacillota bacterium]
MPAIVGIVNVNSISGVLNIGDVRTIAPKSISKTFAGGGSFNSGDNLRVNNGKSITYIHDSDVVDHPIFAEEIKVPKEKDGWS